MEQILSFLLTVILCTVALVVLQSPLLFLISFISGVGYQVIRGRKKGWKLPKDVKNTH